MKSIGRVVTYRELLENSETFALSEIVKLLLKINICVLDGIENYFIEYKEKKQYKQMISLQQFNYILRQNIERLYEIETYSWRINLEELIKDIYNIIEDYKKNKVESKFNKLLTTLKKFNDKHIKTIYDAFDNQVEENVEEYIWSIKRNYYYENYSQVFLSYAYEDHLYTISLFFLFLTMGIELYIDWMRNPPKTNGAELKKILNYALSKSRQFLFLRTPNSELSIGGNYYVRPWCAWELGNYYKHIRDEKFYVCLYGYGGLNNLQLDGLKPLKDIRNGRLLSY